MFSDVPGLARKGWSEYRLRNHPPSPSPLPTGHRLSGKVASATDDAASVGGAMLAMDPEVRPSLADGFAELVLLPVGVSVPPRLTPAPPTEPCTLPAPPLAPSPPLPPLGPTLPPAEAPLLPLLMSPPAPSPLAPIPALAEPPTVPALAPRLPLTPLNPAPPPAETPLPPLLRSAPALSPSDPTPALTPAPRPAAPPLKPTSSAAIRSTCTNKKTEKQSTEIEHRAAEVS